MKTQKLVGIFVVSCSFLCMCGNKHMCLIKTELVCVVDVCPGLLCFSCLGVWKPVAQSWMQMEPFLVWLRFWLIVVDWREAVHSPPNPIFEVLSGQGSLSLGLSLSSVHSSVCVCVCFVDIVSRGQGNTGRERERETLRKENKKR